jgi:sugar phosphate isomerase/epimerase
MRLQDRRHFLHTAAAGLVAVPAAASCPATEATASTLASATGFPASEPAMKFGLVTYLWGQDMDLPTVIDACAKSGLGGVELRTEHKHGVEPGLTKAQRQEVRKRFADSPVTLVGYGSNAQFHENDPAKVKANIELAKRYIQLMHDCGGSGVKVKPNSFVKDVPREKTIEQIGRALNEIAACGQQYGQQIRVEVHGPGTSELPVMKAIFDVADHPNAAICWNSNAEDLKGDGLEHNFRLVSGRFGKTAHVRELTGTDYPWAQLFALFRGIRYDGWVLLEARGNPADKVAALIEQRQAFEKLVSG